MTRIAVLVSGGGTNLQALLDAQARGELGGGEVTCVISSKPGVYALERAALHGLDSCVVARRDYNSPEAYGDALLEALTARGADLVVLAGFLCIFGGKILEEYDRRIINVHPSLIPSFCGKGHYGLRVHQAALDYGVKITGATVHFVSEVVDGGEIILQKAVEVLPGDSAEMLQRRVMEQAEWELLPKAVAMFCTGKLKGKGD